MSAGTQVDVDQLGLDRKTNTPVVILKEKRGERVLPIWIGPSEASAIAVKLKDVQFSRPLTHDLLAAVVEGLGGKLEKVVVGPVEENIYFAQMVVRQNGEEIPVDARPSDAIAVALRLSAGIFADDELLSEPSWKETEGPKLGDLSEESGPPSEHLPEPVLNAWTEADHCQKRGWGIAAELIWRNILMYVAVERGAPVGQDLSGYVSHLNTLGYVEDEEHRFLDRILSREPHELTAPDAPRTLGTRALAAEVLRLAYEGEG